MKIKKLNEMSLNITPDEVLEKTIGVNGAVFCHIGRFIAVAKTKEAILKMASIALG